MGQPERNGEAPHYCDACFTGDYPIQLTDQMGEPDKRQLSLLTEFN